MDKETLSHYGWVIVVVVIIAILIGLATPFARGIKDNIIGVTNRLTAEAANAWELVDNVKGEQGGGSGGGSEGESGGEVSTPLYYGNMDGNTGVIAWYPEMPTTVSEGDIYLNGDYMYLYSNEAFGGWMVSLADEDMLTNIGKTDYPNKTDRQQSSYGPILESINSALVTSLHETFYNCTNMTTAPAIPSGVTNMYCTFYNCTSLTGAITINAAPTEYHYCLCDVDMTNITLTGSASKETLNAIGATGLNWTPIP